MAEGEDVPVGFVVVFDWDHPSSYLVVDSLHQGAPLGSLPPTQIRYCHGKEGSQKSRRTGREESSSGCKRSCGAKMSRLNSTKSSLDMQQTQEEIII